MNTIKRLSTAIAIVLAGGNVGAANIGTDMNLTMMPATGGMGGVGIASPQDVGSAVFGNPATLSQYQGTNFMFGATFYDVSVKNTHDGTTTGTAWSADSEAGPYLVPNIAVSQSLSENTVMGLGLTVVSGVGSDFRGVTGSLDAMAELLHFGANAAAAHKLNDNLTLGASATIGFGLGQAGLSSVTASTSDFGYRATLGATYDIGSSSIGAYYRSPLAFTYDNLVQYAPGSFHSPTLEQPQELAFGFSNESLMNGNLLIGADLIWKNWEDADGYKDIYEDQTVFALGAQLKQGSKKWRIGYIHADSPIKESVGSNLDTISSLQLGGATVPLNPVLMQYIQATSAEVIWEDQITFGFGIDLNKTISVDLHAGLALEREENIGATNVEASAWQVGGALTWHFN